MSKEDNRTRAKAHVMIVDDEEDVTSVLKKGLERHGGFAVTTFTDPFMALSNFKEEANNYDLILLDIKMPKMDGFELYQKLRAIDSKVKICFMTAFEVYYDALKELFPNSYSDICFAKKPFSIDEFAERISKEMFKSAGADLK